MVNENQRRLADLNPQKVFEGDNVKIEEIENKEFTLLDFDERPSAQGGPDARYVRIQADLQGRKIVFNASETVLKRLEELVEQHGKENVCGTIATISHRKSASGRQYWWIN